MVWGQIQKGRTYSGEIAVQDTEHDDACDCVYTDHPKEDYGTAKRGDDHHGGDGEVPNEDGRAKLADETRGVHDHELFVPRIIRLRLFDMGRDEKRDATE